MFPRYYNNMVLLNSLDGFICVPVFICNGIFIFMHLYSRIHLLYMFNSSAVHNGPVIQIVCKSYQYYWVHRKMDKCSISPLSNNNHSFTDISLYLKCIALCVYQYTGLKSMANFTKLIILGTGISYKSSFDV